MKHNSFSSRFLLNTSILVINSVSFVYPYAVTANNRIKPDKPNIIIILADDMGFSDVGCYGSEIETPALDELAENGIRFSQFYNTARCCPTRASLLTGLYPAQTGMGFMTSAEGQPGYRGEIGNQCITIAELLKPAGYKTYMTGKWHVARNLKDIDSLKYNWPLQRGFDKFYGTITGAGSLWDPSTLTRGNRPVSPFSDPEYKPAEKWYYTDAVSDNAIKYIEEHQQETTGQPFFMYVSYTSPHWPLHAPEDEIALQKGKYDGGYAAIREKRYKKLIELELIDEKWPISEQVAQWDTTQNKEWHARNMEVYAAMITRMDKGIGKIVKKLKATGQLDNTLILYLHDNGGCDETLSWFNYENEFDEIPEKPVYDPMDPEDLQTQMFPKQNREGYPVIIMGKKVMAGSDKTYHAYGPNWANVSNTPFRMYKKWVHEGGISTPLIAHWPQKITGKNEIRHQPGHLIDVMATVVDITGAEYPEKFKGNAIHPLPGKSLLKVFTDDKEIERDAIFFEHEGNRGLRQGEWKLVSKASEKVDKFRKTDEIPIDQWALYNMNNDRTELKDLADEYSEIVRKMVEKWQHWAWESSTLPKP